MNVQKLKAKRIEHDLRQKDLAKALNISAKAMCHKECSKTNKFKANEMLVLSKMLEMSLTDFNEIFLIVNYRLFNFKTKKLTKRVEEDDDTK